MRYTSLLLAAALLAVSAPSYAQDTTSSPVPATTATSTLTVGSGSGKALTDAQRSEVEDIIKNYLVNKHPEVLMEAMKELQKRDQEGAEAKSREAISTYKDKIYNDPTSPVGGNPKSDLIMVEFFDFQCGYCKMSEEAVEKELKTDGNIRFIYKDFPILGPMSTTASKAALASVSQGKYIKFHDALMNKKDHLTEDMIYQTAKDVGLDVDKLKKDMNDPEITKIIDANLKLGNDIGVRGTPMFIIGDQIYPGALQFDQLKKAVDDARAAKKN